MSSCSREMTPADWKEAHGTSVRRTISLVRTSDFTLPAEDVAIACSRRLRALREADCKRRSWDCDAKSE